MIVIEQMINKSIYMYDYRDFTCLNKTTICMMFEWAHSEQPEYNFWLITSLQIMLTAQERWQLFVCFWVKGWGQPVIVSNNNNSEIVFLKGKTSSDIYSSVTWGYGENEECVKVNLTDALVLRMLTSV